MRYPVRVLQFLSDSVVHYFYACDRSKQVFLLPVWRDGPWRSEDFSFGAIPIGWRMEKHRARWSLPRWLLTCLRLYVFTDEIFCISSKKNMQTAKVQTFTLLHPSCHKLPILPPPPHQRVSAHHSHNHYTHTPSTSHPSPSSANITQHKSPSHHHVILSLYLNVYRKNPPSPSFGPVPEGWDSRSPLSYITLRLYSLK